MRWTHVQSAGRHPLVYVESSRAEALALGSPESATPMARGGRGTTEKVVLRVRSE